VVLLYSITLCWMLSSPNRILRDRATKGLVRLLSSRIHILLKLLEQFSEIDEPYVLERLYAAAYGCALRNNNKELSKKLAQFVYEKQFKDGKPCLNILLRDYARGIVEISALDVSIPKAWVKAAA